MQSSCADHCDCGSKVWDVSSIATGYAIFIPFIYKVLLADTTIRRGLCLRISRWRQHCCPASTSSLFFSTGLTRQWYGFSASYAHCQWVLCPPLQDRFLSEHVMKLHSSRGRHGDDAAGSRRMTAAAAAASSSSGRSTTPSGNDDPLLLHSSPCQTSEESLLDRLKKQPGEEMDLLPLSLLRKYIAYSRQYVHPRYALM